jgi:hypothetical protein
LDDQRILGEFHWLPMDLPGATGVGGQEGIGTGLSRFLGLLGLGRASESGDAVVRVLPTGTLDFSF